VKRSPPRLVKTSFGPEGMRKPRAGRRGGPETNFSELPYDHLGKFSHWKTPMGIFGARKPSGKASLKVFSKKKGGKWFNKKKSS